MLDIRRSIRDDDWSGSPGKLARGFPLGTGRRARRQPRTLTLPTGPSAPGDVVVSPARPSPVARHPDRRTRRLTPHEPHAPHALARRPLQRVLAQTAEAAPVAGRPAGEAAPRFSQDHRTARPGAARPASEAAASSSSCSRSSRLMIFMQIFAGRKQKKQRGRCSTPSRATTACRPSAASSAPSPRSATTRSSSRSTRPPTPNSASRSAISSVLKKSAEGLSPAGPGVVHATRVRRRLIRPPFRSLSDTPGRRASSRKTLFMRGLATRRVLAALVLISIWSIIPPAGSAGARTSRRRVARLRRQHGGRRQPRDARTHDRCSRARRPERPVRHHHDLAGRQPHRGLDAPRLADGRRAATRSRRPPCRPRLDAHRRLGVRARHARPARRSRGRARGARRRVRRPSRAAATGRRGVRRVAVRPRRVR